MVKGKSVKNALDVNKPKLPPDPLLIFDPDAYEPGAIGGFLTGPAGALLRLVLVHAGQFGGPTPELWESMRGEFMKAFHKAACCVEGRTMERGGDGTIQMHACRESLGRRFASALVKPDAIDAEAQFIIQELRLYAVMHGLAVAIAPPATPMYVRVPPSVEIREYASKLAAIGRLLQAIPADFAASPTASSGPPQQSAVGGTPADNSRTKRPRRERGELPGGWTWLADAARHYKIPPGSMHRYAKALEKVGLSRQDYNSGERMVEIATLERRLRDRGRI